MCFVGSVIRLVIALYSLVHTGVEVKFDNSDFLVVKPRSGICS